MADEVLVSRSVPEKSQPLSPTPEETSGMLESSADIDDTPGVTVLPIETDVPSGDQTIEDEQAGDATIVPQKLRQERPTIGDWVGTWWGKGKGERGPNDKDPPTAGQVPPIPPVKPPSRRRTAKSVFGNLGISILNPVPSSSTSKRRPIVVDEATPPSDAISIMSGRSGHSTHTNVGSLAVSVVSSPAIPSFAPSPAAPLISTVFDNLLASSQGLSTKASSLSPSQDPPVVLTQGATLRAIANATRVMSSDPNSILSDHDTGPLISRLAMQLVANARDQGISFHERPKERRDTRMESSDSAERAGAVGHMAAATGSADAAMALNRTLLAQSEGIKKTKPSGARAASIMQVAPQFASSPLFGSFMTQQARKPSVMSDRNVTGGSDHASATPGARANTTNSSSANAASLSRKPLSVPLESIIPATAKPPTHYLSRTYTPLTSRDFRFTIPLPQSASKYTIYHDDKNQRPLTDRYGFMYDVSQYDVLLLIRAKECGSSAPACLTGVKIADREENNSWPDDDDETNMRVKIEIVKESCPCSGDLDVPVQGHSDSASAGGVDSNSIDTKSRSSSKSRKTRHRASIATSGIVSLGSIAPASILSVNADTPRHACANTVRRLLDQLTEIHDAQQAAQRREWDAFVKQRSRVRPLKAGGAAPAVGGGSGAAAILGLGTAGEDDELAHSDGLIGFAQLGLSTSGGERRAFERLVRSGVPLVYRAKVWLESSGALEMQEPGVFQDLLAQSDAGDGVAGEIEKDVGRTMPLNIFFGGDGAGVDKLRRVLLAYSRYVLHLVHLCDGCTDDSAAGGIRAWGTARG